MADYSFDLSGRVAFVTGASSGSGSRFARVLARSGAKVVVAARRASLLEGLAKEIAAAGGEALPVTVDVTDEASIVAAYDAAAERFGPVDTVIANAGANVGVGTLGLAVEDFDRTVAVAVRGAFLTAREGARRMIAAGSAERSHGRITIISSITAHQPAAGIAHYAATKAAVTQMGRSLAKDWARKGINVNVLCPGYVSTEMNEAIWSTKQGQKLLSGFARPRAMDGDALDVMVLYLSSGVSGQVTGSIITIDDGQTLG